MSSPDIYGFILYKGRVSYSHSECKLKRLITDDGGEYTSMEFARFCNEEGIEHEVIAPYTPLHNGIAGRKNRSILNIARSMLKANEMTKRF